MSYTNLVILKKKITKSGSSSPEDLNVGRESNFQFNEQKPTPMYMYIVPYIHNMYIMA